MTGNIGNISVDIKISSILDSIAFISNDVQDRPVVVAVNSHKEKFTVFLDTGSPVSIMDKITYESFFREVPLIKSQVNLHGLGNGGLRCIGEIIPTFWIANVKISGRISVVDNIDMFPIVILGHALQRKHNIIWDPTTETALIQGKRVQKGHTLNLGNRSRRENGCSSDESEAFVEDESVHKVNLDSAYVESAVRGNQEVKVVLSNDVDIPAQGTSFIKVRVKRKFKNSELVIDGNSCPIAGIKVIDCLLMSNQKGICTLEVSNECNKAICLQEGAMLCVAEKYGNPIIEIGAISNSMSEEESEKIIKEIEDKVAKDIQDKEIRIRFMNVLTKYKECFATEDGKLGLASNIEHHIELKDDKKITYVPSYRLPQKHIIEIEKQVEQLKRDGIVANSTSPYNSPLLIVPKKGGTWRLVVDYRKINENTVPDRFPTHNVEDVLCSFGSNRFFSSLDLLKGYWQIAMAKDSRELTAFSTARGHYEWTRMPFGLRNAPTTFARLVKAVFGDLVGSVLEVYMDDLVIASKTLEEHLEKLEIVLGRIREHNLKIKITKCDFFKSQLQYLGFVVSQDGLKVVQAKAEAIAQFPVPKSVKNLQTFLGMCGYYRKFIFRFSTIAAPLTDLLKKDTPFRWDEEQQRAFDSLKEKLLKPPILIFPSFKDTFYLATDASDTGVGGVLLQIRSGIFHPISFFSRKLKTVNPNECAMSTIDRECTAIVNSLFSFKFLIYGCETVVLTDHLPLVHFFKDTKLNNKRIRWKLILEDFDVKVKYVPGKLNIIADCMSRNSLDSDQIGLDRLDREVLAIVHDSESPEHDFKKHKERVEFDWDFERIREEQLKDPKLHKLIKKLESGTEMNGYILRNNVLCKVLRYKYSASGNTLIDQVIIPATLRKEVLSYLHEEYAHPGVHQMCDRARQNFHWIGIRKDIQRLIKDCVVCNRAKGVPNSTQVFKYPPEQRPFNRIHMDLVGGFSETAKGNKHILVCIDSLTRYTEVIPLRTKTAIETAEMFYRKWVCRYGIPTVIVTDSGLEFQNCFLNSLCQQLGIRKANIVCYHPMSNGLAERANQKLLDVLRITIGAQEPNWDYALPHCMWIINTAPHRILRFSPYEALFGFVPPSPFDINIDFREIPEPLRYDVQIAQARFQLLRDRLEMMDIITKKECGETHIAQYEPGDQVYIKKNVRKGLNYKLQDLFEGPYTVLRVLRAGRVVIQKDQTTKTVASDQIRKK